MPSWPFKLGFVLVGTSLLGGLLDFFFVSNASILPRVLLCYLALGGAGAILMFLGRKPRRRSW